MLKPIHHYILMFVVFAGVLTFCLNRDIKLERQYTVDLRNRIIGARLQMDGKPPYFYYWKPQDGLRYYDPEQADTTYSNALTASPFFHHLLFPVANLPHRQISRIWLLIEYIMLFASSLLVFSLARTIVQKWACVITFSLFMFTAGWIAMISAGQMYLLIPFCCFIVYFCITGKKQFLFFFLGGMAAATLILTKPTSILFFVPFILIVKQFRWVHIATFFIPIVALIGYSAFDSKEQSFWVDYFKAIDAHIKFHQATKDELTGAYKRIIYQKWEGWDIDSIKAATFVEIHSESSSLGIVARDIFHKKIPAKTIEIILTVILVFVSAIFFYQNQKRAQPPDMAILAIFGFCLYMITDFISPLWRIQYYAVQWLFPLLLFSAYYERRFKTIYILIIIGLILNILNTPYIKMRHTIGEMIILFALLSLCFNPKYRLTA